MGTDYRIKRMPLEALDRVFLKMKNDFPRGELKPKVFLRRQMKSGVETGWLLLVDDREAGYAFVVSDVSVPLVLLDYLAVDRRGQGDGSAFLAKLQQEYPQGMVVESEDEVPQDSDEENDVRIRRMNFYRRAGFQPCPFDHEIFGVRYLVHLWLPDMEPVGADGSASDDVTAQAETAIKDLYRIQFPKLHR